MKPNRDKPVVIQVFASFRYAFAGLCLLTRDRNMIVHLLASVLAVALAAWLGLSAVEWALLAFTIALVLSLEAVNSAIEYVVDLASPDIHPLAGKAKDVSAAAVLIAAIGAVFVGVMLFLPKLMAT